MPDDGWQRTTILLAVKVAIVCFLLAGLGGGVIASHIPEYKDFDRFAHSKDTKLGISGWKRSYKPFSWWEHFEHRSFWAGIVIAAFGFIIAVW